MATDPVKEMERERIMIEPSHEAIATPGAPAAIGPYSQAIRLPAIHLVFTAGQIGLDPKDGELVAGGVEAEFRQVLDNLEAVLTAAGTGLSRIVKSTIYMIDLAEFRAVNAIYAERIDGLLPARSTVGVSSLPKGARVEMEVIASLGS